MEDKASYGVWLGPHGFHLGRGQCCPQGAMAGWSQGQEKTAVAQASSMEAEWPLLCVWWGEGRPLQPADCHWKRALSLPGPRPSLWPETVPRTISW
jgi:hypothetical protein